MDTTGGGEAQAARYRRPYAVAESLDLLHGPSSGTVQLPTHRHGSRSSPPWPRSAASPRPPKRGWPWNRGTSESRRSPREQLLELAANADHGFDRLLFADALGALTQITDAAFTEYRAEPSMITDMRHRFGQWRQELLGTGAS
jgi:hypothetical protein